jgi:hypothetical protein
MLRPERMVFDGFVAPFPIGEVLANIKPCTPAQLKSCISEIMAGRVDYHVEDTADPRLGPACHAYFPTLKLAIFFNKGPANRFDLIDAEYQE